MPREDESAGLKLDVWNEAFLNAIGEKGILSGDDLDCLYECMPDIIQAHFTTQIFRTRTEMEISVLNDVMFPTPDAKYWQAVREMNVHVENLFLLIFDYGQKLLDADLLDHEIAFEKMSEGLPYEAVIKQRKKALELMKLKFELFMMQREAHHRIREIAEWSSIQNKLRPRLVCDDRDVDAHQLVSYSVRFLKEAYAASRSGSGLGVEAMRNLIAHVETALRLARVRGVEEKIFEECEKTPDLMDFLVKSGIVKRKGSVKLKGGMKCKL